MSARELKCFVSLFGRTDRGYGGYTIVLRRTQYKYWRRLRGGYGGYAEATRRVLVQILRGTENVKMGDFLLKFLSFSFNWSG